jgi:N-acetylmuramic acid 6-phosphate etherase
MKKSENVKYLGIDIGGTWIKGAVVDESYFLAEKPWIMNFQSARIKSPLHARVLSGFIDALKLLIAELNIKPGEIKGLGISSGGIINYGGTRIVRAAAHLNILKSEGWNRELEKQLKCSTVIINDGDAASIGLAETGFLKGDKAVGIMPVGTGLGLTVWRNGRRWRPGKSLTLLGSIRTPDGNFDSVASASGLAGLDKENNLVTVLTSARYEDELKKYVRNLAGIINTAAIIYSLDEVIICGGLADAVTECGFPLEQQLNEILQAQPAEMEKPAKVLIAREGNRLQLIGALALARGESIAIRQKIVPGYNSLETEIPYKKDLHLQNMESLEIIETLWRAEQEAGDLLKSSLPVISDIADESVKRTLAGGRIIYVGAGTSGRIAAMDAVEIPCTYGFPGNRILALIAGGLSDSAMEIESDFEEDASAVPEILLMNIRPEDIVIGISASGTAWYVQSALACAKSRRAMTVMIQASLPDKKLPFCDYVVPLNSGNEVVAGSTRMKAGTSTKKVLNFLSSAIMIRMGKVAGPYMVDVECINHKLVERAQSILNILYGIDKEEALERLKSCNMDLGKAIVALGDQGRKD